ncbi:tol-pal system protein YbgF [Vibrio aerogenes CECT 7868]|uniref:Cell division coordinator CpoB n=1 Tax=Vibrio aerogenes CECT 7868 TaxID=1216006 RepID=A0A1M5X8Y2_9VIBR|nr:tol-pal system protein YbgF [Vibrio aerogenes]SHH96102.1 tol-pal system protein YbgF [Vibrio aerogenes CECT 7868]
MFGNLRRLVGLVFLSSAASVALAAQPPAPVSDLNSISGASGTVSKVQQLERMLQNRNEVQLQMQQQLDEMADEIQHLRGIVEKNSHEMQQMVQRQRELFIELDRLRSQAGKQTEATSEEQQQSAGTFSSNVSEQQAYQDAVDLILKKRDYSGAISAFNQFQKDFPKSNFAPNAHYWLGQLYFAKKQDKKAEENFKAVLTYKKSNKRADALVKLGDIEKRHQNKQQANQYYQQAIKEYPDSASAKSAEQSLIP